MADLSKLRMVIELEYDAESMHGGDADEEGKLWFYGDILNGDPSNLVLHDNGDLGDDIGTVKVIWIGEDVAFERMKTEARALAQEWDREREELLAALREAETVMMIVQPRSHMKEYLAALETVRAALAKAKE